MKTEVHDADRQTWHARARAVHPGGLALINGALVPSRAGQSFDCISPIDGRKLASVPACDREDVDLAVAAARASFERRDWADQAPSARKRVLLRFAECVETATEELALLETLDVGKPIRDSLIVDVPATVRCLRWYAEAIDKRYDEVAPTGSETLALITREPVGVVGAIVPWNFPMIIWVPGAKQWIDHRRAMWITAQMMADLYNHDLCSRDVAEKAIHKYNQHIERCNRAI